MSGDCGSPGSLCRARRHINSRYQAVQLVIRILPTLRVELVGLAEQIYGVLIPLVRVGLAVFTRDEPSDSFLQPPSLNQAASARSILGFGGEDRVAARVKV